MENPYESPRVGDEPIGRRESSPLSSILFSFEGRIPRRVYWGAMLATAGIFYAIVFLLFAVFGTESSVPAIVVLILYIPVVWISLAVQVKRWHDRDKSGWWVFINVIPLIGPLWSLIEIGCLRGTEGRNQYGYDPT